MPTGICVIHGIGDVDLKRYYQWAHANPPEKEKSSKGVEEQRRGERGHKPKGVTFLAAS